MNAVVNRGSYDSTVNYVNAAMKSNPTNAGEAGYPEVDYTPEDGIPKPHWATQYWEAVVKKGNSDFNDKQVAKAEKLKPEPNYEAPAAAPAARPRARRSCPCPRPPCPCHQSSPQVE